MEIEGSLGPILTKIGIIFIKMFTMESVGREEEAVQVVPSKV